MTVILREWKGRTAARRSEEYPAHFHARVVPELRRVDGFLGAMLLARNIGEQIEFTVHTRWSSLEAVIRFAGSEPDRAVVEPGAVAALDDFDAFVVHHRVINIIE
jgi:heme-degrading monooxygenase HmoA